MSDDQPTPVMDGRPVAVGSTEPIVIDGADRVHIITASELATAAEVDDWPEARAVVTAPDRAFIRGRYVHGGMPPNRNGHLFRTEQLVTAHTRVPHTPLNMLHRIHHVIGAFVATRLVYPQGTGVAADAVAFNDSPYVESLAVMWKYAFPDEYRAIREAHERGLSHLSMEAIPETVTCPTCDTVAPWAGYESDAYCAHMNGPGKPRWMDNPLFLGGAAVIPPARPGWKDAAITKIAAYMDRHPDQVEHVYERVAAMSPHLDPGDVEAIMALLIGHTQADHPDMGLDPRRMVAPLWEAITDGYDDIDLVPPRHVSDAVAAASAAGVEALAPAEAVRVRNLAAGRPQPPATVRRIASDLTMWKPVDRDRFALFGGDATLAWAIDVAGRLDAADAASAATDAVARPDAPTATIAVVPPVDVAKALAALGNQPAEEIHITLTFLGAISDDGERLTGEGEASIDDVLAVATAVAVDQKPLQASTTGRGSFDQGDYETVWAAVDAPGLAELYTRLSDAFGASGVWMARNHGFTPHITLTQRAHGEGPTVVPSGLEFTIDALELWWGGQRTRIPFGAPTPDPGSP